MLTQPQFRVQKSQLPYVLYYAIFVLENNVKFNRKHYFVDLK